MEHEIHTFKEWGYPFIAQDFQDAAGVDCSGLLLGGIVLFDEDFNPNTEYVKAVEKGKEYVENGVPAIMIELAHLNGQHRIDVELFFTEFFEKNGYTNLESYENRLAYGKFPKGELK